MHLLGLVNLSTLVLHNEVFTQCFEEIFRCQTIQVFYHTVVVEDGELRSLEADSHEEVVFLIALVVGVLLLFLCAH